MTKTAILILAVLCAASAKPPALQFTESDGTECTMQKKGTAIVLEGCTLDGYATKAAVESAIANNTALNNRLDNMEARIQSVETTLDKLYLKVEDVHPPTLYPTAFPTDYPTEVPTAMPTHSPTAEPTANPTPSSFQCRRTGISRKSSSQRYNHMSEFGVDGVSIMPYNQMRSQCSCSLGGYSYHQCRGINDGGSGNGASWIPGCGNAWAQLTWSGEIDLVGWQTSRRGAYNNNWRDYGDRTGGTFQVSVLIKGDHWCHIGSFSRSTPNTEKWMPSGMKGLRGITGIKFWGIPGGACIDEFIIYKK
jgi:hypothetical protein